MWVALRRCSAKRSTQCLVDTQALPFPRNDGLTALAAVSEGAQTTLGAIQQGLAVINDTNSTRLSLGPLQFHWPKADMQTPLPIKSRTSPSRHRIPRRNRLFQAPGISDTRTGSTRLNNLPTRASSVVLSTFALVEAQSELSYIRRLCENGEILVEANDMSAVQMLASKVPFVGGPTLNVLQSALAAKAG